VVIFVFLVGGFGVESGHRSFDNDGAAA